MNRELSRDAGLVLFLCAIGALAAALVAQYGFGLSPCQLCLYQRVPYGVVILLALLLLILRPTAKQSALLLALCALAFVTDSGLALYHVGVEQHWWAGPASCSSTGGGGAQSVEDLMAQLSKPIKLPSCDQIAWSLFGVSMAGYNLLACVGLAGFSGLMATRSLGRRV
jgi:disulfide bond formation protein DsbB